MDRSKPDIWSNSLLEELLLFLNEPKPARRCLREVPPEEEISSFVEDSLDLSFPKALFRLIDSKGMDDVEVYKRGGIDRRVFSKLKSSPDYQPSKNTAIRFCLGVKAKPKEAIELMETAGYTLSKSKKEDLVILFCLKKEIYDVNEVNAALKRLGLEEI